MRQRFAHEARIGARIASEHVVEVVSAGVDTTSALPWLAMELLARARSLRPFERAGRRPVGRRARGARRAVPRLQPRTTRGIVHRDLKPENVFVAAARRVGVPFTVKVLDFGIAKLGARGASKRTTGKRIGSPLWMAPEQLRRAAAITPATDVWALGLLAYWMLTGGSFWVRRHAPRGHARHALASRW
jgi:serine/threonine protein kinase